MISLDSDTRTRVQIAALLFTMSNAVVFGAGLIGLLMLGLSAQATGLGIALITVCSIVIAGPIAWMIAPRLRTRYWRRTGQGYARQ